VTISVLHKCHIFNICQVTLYTDSRAPHTINYELRDDFSKLSQDAWLSGVRAVDTGGDFSLDGEPSAETIAAIVPQLVRRLEEQYLAASAYNYKDIIANGKRH